MPTLIIYGFLALAILGALGGIGYKVREAGYDACKVEWSDANQKAQKSADAQAARDMTAKEKADAENRAAVAALNSRIAKLRNERDARRPDIVPAAPSGSGCPQGQACFDRAELERTLRDYRAAVRGLIDEGSALEADLNTARAWAQR